MGVGGLLTRGQSFYINYFKLLATMIKEGEKMTPEKNKQAMAFYATLPTPPGEVELKMDP